MPSITLNLPQELYDQISLRFSRDAIGPFVIAATTEWAEWLDGTFRPMSVSELEMSRIFAIYETILQDDLPSTEHLGEVFDLPLGRARYIVQSLRYKHRQFYLKQVARSVLTALDDGEWSEDRSDCTIHVERECRRMIDGTLSTLVAEGRLRSTVSGIDTMQFIQYKLGSNHYEELRTEFEHYLSEIEGED